jgi:hypothetical protein
MLLGCMADPLLLYSTNTWLAYTIAQRFYDHTHYVWCAPFFDARSVPAVDFTTPPSSSPAEIYAGLQQDARRGDRHSRLIEENRDGIRRGIAFRLEENVISEAQRTEVTKIVETAHPADFRPLLYVMPFAAVGALVREAPVEERAHPLSVEFVIQRLPRHLFDILEWESR